MIWNRIKVLRAERDWTQADLADKVGISRQAVISIEKYKYTPSLELAFKIAEVFGVSIDEVLSIGRINNMNEQIIILVFLIIALGITLWLYISKAKKQVKYRGDERWQLIQLKASNTANLAHSILIVLIAVLPLFINMQTTVTLQRVSIFALLYIGIRNLIELVATIYFDKRL